MYKLNLQNHAFETFTQINSIYFFYNMLGGVVEIGKTQIIKTIQNYFKKNKK
jgi:hypothetical protein